MLSQTTGTITPMDFNKNTADKNRHLWTPGPMRHLIKVLNGHPVMLVADVQTGHTLFNVTLEGLRRTPGYGTFQVLIRYEYAEGKYNKTWTSLYSLGPAITWMPGAGRENSKWKVLDSYREECSKATALARARWEAAGEEAYGKTEATPMDGDVHVRWTSQLAEHRGMGILTPTRTMTFRLEELA
jgi:hypothetical protein